MNPICNLLGVRYLDPGNHEVADSWLAIANDFRVCAAGDVLRRLPLSLCRGHVTVELTCTERHADRAAGHELEIDFATDGHGNIDGLQIGGVGDVDGCVAKIINDARLVDDEA